jgi:hypothetical protein
MQAEQAQVEQVQVERQAPQFEAAQAEEPRREEPRREEPRREEPRREEPRVDPKELLESAGLVMIETDRSKVPVQAPAVEEPQAAGRPRRERPKPAPQDDELMQVETTRK